MKIIYFLDYYCTNMQHFDIPSFSRELKRMNSIPCIYVIGVKPYKCELCDKRFARDQQRRVHQVVHTGDKSHLCCECGQSFGSASTLIDHKKRKHLFMRDHQCQKCNKGFFTRQELEAHMRVHTGDKPYQCPVSFNFITYVIII